MKLGYAAICMTLTVFLFQNCSNAEYEVSDSIGSEPSVVSDQSGDAGAAGSTSETSSTTAEVTEDAPASVSLPQDDNGEVRVEVPEGADEVLVQIPPADEPGAQIIVSVPEPLQVPQDGSWILVPQIIENFQVQLPDFINGSGTVTLDGQNLASLEEQIRQLCTIDGVFSQSLFQNMSYSFQYTSTVRTTVTTMIMTRSINLGTVDRQSITLPAGGSQLLVQVPEGQNSFVLRIPQAGGQQIQVCQD